MLSKPADWLRRLCWLGLCLPAWAYAAPLRTWGGPEPSESEPPDGEPTASEPSAPAAAEEPPERAEPVLRAPRGLRYTLDDVVVSGNTRTRAAVVLGFVPFHPGDSFEVNDERLEQARFRLFGTGFFRDVHFSLRRGRERGRAVLVVNVRERNTLVVNDVWLGISADAEPDGGARPLTAYGGLDVAENNLFGTGLSLGGAAAVADRQLALRARFLDPDFRHSGFTLYGQLLYSAARDFFGQKDVLVSAAPAAEGFRDDALGVATPDAASTRPTDYAVVSYKRFGGAFGIGHELGAPQSRAFLEYRLESIDATLPLAASHLRGGQVEPIDFYLPRGTSMLSVLRASYVYDTRDQSVLAERGIEAGILTEGSLRPMGSDFPYFKVQGRVAKYTRLPWHHVVKLELFGGAIFGDAPLFARYYVGDFSDLLPDRVLDLNVDRRPAPNLFGTAIREVRYGTYAARLLGEYRVPLYRGRRSVWGVDAFGSVGLYAVADERDITQPAAGYTGLRQVPFDLTFNLGLRADTILGKMTLGVSTLVGFLPLREDAR